MVTPQSIASPWASFGIVGGGLVGMAVALNLRERFPKASITLWEKEKGVGLHQSTHNSGVLHAGLYYQPGSLKARLAVEGIREMTAYCRRHGIAHEICGKLVIATTPDEVTRLRELSRRARLNGLRDVQWLEQDRIQEHEPNAAGLAALRVPEEGIVDYAAVCAAMLGDATNQDIAVHCDTPVLHMADTGDGWRVETRHETHRCTYLFNCAGLHCDRIAHLAGVPVTTRIVPFRGEYYKLRPNRQHLVRNLIYPVPDATFPFLGVHFTRLIHGGMEAGPNAVLATAREGYRKRDVNLSDLADALTFPGLWRFMAQHRSMCFGELHRSFSRREFCAALRRLVPAIEESDLEPGGSGVRAQAMERSGKLVQDFVLVRQARALHVLNAPSPAATASLAIGREIVSQIAGPMTSPLCPCHGSPGGD